MKMNEGTIIEQRNKLETGTCKTDTDEFAPAFNQGGTQRTGPGTTGESHIGRQQTLTHPPGVAIGVGTGPYQRGTPREASAPDRDPSPLNMQMILVKNQDEAAGLDSTHSADRAEMTIPLSGLAYTTVVESPRTMAQHDKYQMAAFMRTHNGFRAAKSPPGYLARLEQRRSRDVPRTSLQEDGSPGREKPAEIKVGAAMKRH